jgi:hypothetical protein
VSPHSPLPSNVRVENDASGVSVSPADSGPAIGSARNQAISSPAWSGSASIRADTTSLVTTNVPLHATASAAP